MQVTIGVQNVSREVSIECDETVEQVTAAVEEALRTPEGLLRLTDDRGRHLVVPGKAIGWVQVGDADKAKVGFGLT